MDSTFEGQSKLAMAFTTANGWDFRNVDNGSLFSSTADDINEAGTTTNMDDTIESMYQTYLSIGLMSDVEWNWGRSKFSQAFASKRQTLITAFNLTWIDGGQE